MPNRTREKAQAIHDKTMELLGTVGMRFLHPQAVEILRKHGVKTDGNTAYFTEDEIMKCVEKAPEKVTIHARDPRYDITLGDGSTHVGPLMGAVRVLQPNGSFRPATIGDAIKSCQIVEYNPRFHLNSGLICIPSELRPEMYMFFQMYAGLLLSSKIPPDVSGDCRTMEACFDILAASFGCRKEELKEKPRMLAGINVNSPLYLSELMTETLFTSLKYRQPCYLAPAAMGGSTSPVTTAGTIVQNNAEVLGALVLAQMYAPGAPVLYGSQSTGADMHSLDVATGAPEAALCFKYAGIMGEFYHLPVRTGGLLTDTPRFNVQAGYESMLNFLSCEQNHVDVVLHAAGCMDSYLALSYEKMVSDFQVIDYADVFLRDIEINAQTVPMEDFRKHVPAGEFVTAKSTLEQYDRAVLDPIISIRGSKARKSLESCTSDYIEKALGAYRAPDLPADCKAAMREAALSAGLWEAAAKKLEDAVK